MNIEFTARAAKDFSGPSAQLKAQVRKQFALLGDNLRHPSIRAKKVRRGQRCLAGKGQPGLSFLLPDRR